MISSLFTGLLVCFIAAGCQTVPITGRQQLNLVSPSQEVQMGVSAFAELKKEAEICKDESINSMVGRVGKRIASVADLQNAEWEFVVFENDEANAFCLPGGKVGVYTGILEITKNEAGMATVLSHEIAHAAAHHGAERMTQGLLLQTGGELIGQAISEQDTEKRAVFNTVYGLGAQLGVALPHSRRQEYEADHIGLVYMARAGYDPQEAVSFWRRFAEYSRAMGTATPWFLRTHPLDEDRIRNIESLLSEAKIEYENYRRLQN